MAAQPEPAGTSARQRTLILAAAGLGLALAVATGVVSATTGRVPGAGTALQAAVPVPAAIPAGEPGSAPSATGPAGAGTGPGASPGGSGAAGPEATGPATTGPGSTPPVVAGLSAKDPFRPLVTSTPDAGAGGAQAPATGGTATPPATTVPGAAPGTAVPAGGGGTTTRKVTLVDVLRRSGVRYAKVEVGSTTYQVREGQAFAGSYKAVDIGTSCAEFLSGSTAFTLCEGEAVLK